MAEPHQSGGDRLIAAVKSQDASLEVKARGLIVVGGPSRARVGRKHSVRPRL